MGNLGVSVKNIPNEPYDIHLAKIKGSIFSAVYFHIKSMVTSNTNHNVSVHIISTVGMFEQHTEQITELTHFLHLYIDYNKMCWIRRTN